MTDQEIKIREMEERIKRLEDKVFNQWLSQYDTYPNVTVDFEHNYHYNDMPTVGPFHGCSQEEIDENNRKWKEYLDKHKEYK